ncbi:peptidylprolyl isomerase [Alloprevotella sp. oral taxon 473]|jgi:peptidyl-prolyl cis-trans isomerase|uniref:peptidylprolyl isomerase n=1 Tax=Alloprevotella sp. oral taxon 473 TaxID=712469 RepID=UPI0002A38AE5|nr:peptidylprolyl isomerase [Alloprevotella sp. oral taxon 473]EKX91085.1 peptidyl-prolyl cis-trans isomerase, cyclophilin-type [Alloprevotella sp. oral taxon 473 str. F0040]
MKQILLFLLLLLTTPTFAQSSSTASLNQDIEIEFKTTMGDFRVRLFSDTPIHSQHFAQLVREGYYDGLLFHRVIRNFMIQAGDSTSRTAKPNQPLGEADRNYTLAPEFRTPLHYHHRGALAAARESDDVNPERRSSATQFYVVWGKRWTPNELANVREHVDAETGANGLITDNMALDYYTRGGSPHLDGQYTVFGEVSTGLEIIDKIQKVNTDRNDRPRVDVRILSARILTPTLP